MKRSEILAELHQILSNSLIGKDSYLKRVGNIFFRLGDAGCVQRNVVYDLSKHYKFNFELLSMDWHYFTGTKAHALALQEAFGGTAYPSEYTAVIKPMDLWIWEGPERKKQRTRREHPTPLDFETVKAVLFDEA